MNNFIIIDIETPYSFCEYDGIREVAALVVENYEIIDTLHLAKIYDAEAYKQGYGFGLHAIEEDKKFIKTFKNFIKKYLFTLVLMSVNDRLLIFLHLKMCIFNMKFPISLNLL
jgi:hypothetical protein